jgi:hypothetical protein
MRGLVSFAALWIATLAAFCSSAHAQKMAQDGAGLSPHDADAVVKTFLAAQHTDEEHAQAQGRAIADLNSDGKPEIVLVWTTLGPTYWHNTLTVFSETSGRYKPVSSLQLNGEARLSSVKDGVIAVNQTMYGKNDSICCPTVKKLMNYRWNGNKLSDVATAEAVVPVRRAPGSRWEYVLTDYPGSPRHVLVTGPAGGQESPHIHFWCQVNSRTAELRLDPSKYDPNSSEGERFRFLLEIRNESGNAQTFPIVAYSTGPDGGSQFYSRDFLSTPLMDAFGQEGGVLKWRTDKGAEIASWPLSGSTDARAMVRKNCGV